jgi:hypothetical protein
MAAADAYASFFDNPDLSDAEVVFSGPDGGGRGLDLARMPAHRIVLKPASERWAAELERWPPQQAGAAADGRPPPAVTIGLAGAHELPVGRALVRALYCGMVDTSGLVADGGWLEGGGGGEIGGGGRAAREAAALLRLLELAHCSLLAGVTRLVCGRLAALAEGGALSWETGEDDGLGWG